jgi:hypothetical protein
MNEVVRLHEVLVSIVSVKTLGLHSVMGKYLACSKNKIKYEYCVSSSNGWEIEENHSNIGRFVKVMCIGV